MNKESALSTSTQELKERKTKKKSKKRKRYSSSDSDSDNRDKKESKKRKVSTSSDSDSYHRKKKKKHKHKRKKDKSKKLKKEEKIAKPNVDNSVENVDRILLDRAKAMAPMTKEEWEKRQNVVRRVYDKETNRHRLIKGDGEVLEEIVSKERHKEINRKATKGDGEFFQSQISTLSSK